MRPRRRPHVGLPLLIGSGVLFALLVAPNAFSSLLAALWFFFADLGAGVIRLENNLWQATPFALRPLWGVGFCSIALLMLAGTLVFHLIRRLRNML